MTEALSERIKRHESFRSKTYLCSEGYPTIGYGHRMSTAEQTMYAGGITMDKAEQLFADDFAKAKTVAQTISGKAWPLHNAARQGVLIEMVFQMGMKVLKFHQMLNALDALDYAAAAHEMRDSLWNKQTPSRCDELSKIMEKGAC